MKATVSRIQASPSPNPALGLLRFETDAGEVILAVPQDTLPKLAALALSLTGAQTGERTGIEVQAGEVVRIGDRLGLAFDIGGPFGVLLFALGEEAREVILKGLAR